MKLPVIVALSVVSTIALARDNGQWGYQPLNVRQWFQSLTQPDNPYMSCCGEADAYEADDFAQEDGHYVAIITKGDEKFPEGTRVVIPDNKIKFDKGNPTGHGIVFLGYDGRVYCYITPGGI
jgi:hypothetical protein